MDLSNYNIEEPNICPHCHIVNEPKYLYHLFTHDLDNINQIITLWQCANKDCKRKFPALYFEIGPYQAEFLRFLDGLPKGPDWPKPILDLKSGRSEDIKSNEDIESNIDSRFINTYLQSLKA